ncbi:MAG: hypothetical protein LGR52_03390 [Candidatus Thiosymbion ectosymbiont of Robbea hypermnestra]|nr:hypothetical protein [Candidatus Thiosymbion ectosymbiont of Robbea hypermnestra]
MADAFHSLLNDTRVLKAMAKGADIRGPYPKTAVQKAWFARVCPPVLIEALDLDAPVPQVLEDPTNKLCRAVLPRFQNGESKPEPLCPVPTNRAKILVQQGLELLGSWNAPVCETVRTLLPIILAVDVASRRAGGASLSDLPGVIWIRLGNTWRAEDAAESLLHEAVHQSLFLHDAVYGVFEESAFIDPPQVPSAVRTIYPSNQEPIRTFWAAFHALCVAEWLVVWFWERKPLLAKQFETAIAMSRHHLKAHAHLLTPLGKWLLDNGYESKE